MVDRRRQSSSSMAASAKLDMIIWRRSCRQIKLTDTSSGFIGFLLGCLLSVLKATFVRESWHFGWDLSLNLNLEKARKQVG